MRARKRSDATFFSMARQLLVETVEFQESVVSVFSGMHLRSVIKFPILLLLLMPLRVFLAIAVCSDICFTTYVVYCM